MNVMNVNNLLNIIFFVTLVTVIYSEFYILHLFVTLIKCIIILFYKNVSFL